MNIDTPRRLSFEYDQTKEATTNPTLSPTPSSLSSAQSQVEKDAYRKADIRLLLWYSFVYLIMRIHVQNVTNSAIMNLESGDGIKEQLGGLDSKQCSDIAAEALLAEQMDGPNHDHLGNHQHVSRSYSELRWVTCL